MEKRHQRESSIRGSKNFRYDPRRYSIYKLIPANMVHFHEIAFIPMNSSKISIDSIITISNSYITGLCASILFLNILLIFFLSCSWIFYLIYRIMKDHRIFKTVKKSKNGMDQLDYDNIAENSYIRLVKNTFFLVICLNECGISISASVLICITNLYENNLRGLHLHPHSSAKGFLYTSLFSISRRIGVILLSASFYSILSCARLLTEFLCCKYDYFETRPYLSSKILLTFCIVPVLILIGIFRQLFPFSLIGFSFALTYQFILLFFAARKLKRLLFKRLFDAQNLESQPLYVVKYFRRAYSNFKYASAILLIALFLQTLGYSMAYINSIVMMIVYLPRAWLSTILLGTEEKFRHSPSADRYNGFIAEIEFIVMTLGTSLQIIPYLLVSIRLFCCSIRNNFGKIEEKYNHSQIKTLIARNNNSYLRNHHIS